jgi:LAGLIDADG DNA endonuclease family
MDDGQRVKNGGIILCTDSFELEEVKYLISVLHKKYNLDCTIHSKISKTDKIYS